MIHDEKTAKAMLVQSKYTNDLMKKKHVVGVAVGMVQKTGVPSGDVGLVVMVDQKVPLDMVSSQDQVPAQLDGVPVEVREIGTPRAQ